jgi:hypothetical protein
MHNTLANRYANFRILIRKPARSYDIAFLHSNTICPLSAFHDLGSRDQDKLTNGLLPSQFNYDEICSMYESINSVLPRGDVYPGLDWGTLP